MTVFDVLFKVEEIKNEIEHYHEQLLSANSVESWREARSKWIEARNELKHFTKMKLNDKLLEKFLEMS